MITAFALAGLTFLAVMLVSSNNLSACVGPAVGSRIISKRAGAVLGALGYSAGLLIQGWTMRSSVAGLLPEASALLRVEALLVAVLVFVAAQIGRIPLSLNMSLVGLLAGFSVSAYSSVNLGLVGGVILTWIVAPFAAFGLGFFFVRFLNKSRPVDFWRRLQTYKVLLIVLSFSCAYVLGANTLGLVVATGGFDLTTALAGVAGVFVGTFLLGEGVIRRVSQEFYLMRYANATAALFASAVLVEAATLFNVPLSNTQTTAAAVFGTGNAYKTKMVSVKPFLIIVAGWVVAPLVSFAVGLLIG